MTTLNKSPTLARLVISSNQEEITAKPQCKSLENTTGSLSVVHQDKQIAKSIEPILVTHEYRPSSATPPPSAVPDEKEIIEEILLHCFRSIDDVNAENNPRIIEELWQSLDQHQLPWLAAAGRQLFAEVARSNARDEFRNATITPEKLMNAVPEWTAQDVEELLARIHGEHSGYVTGEELKRFLGSYVLKQVAFKCVEMVETLLKDIDTQKDIQEQLEDGVSERDQELFRTVRDICIGLRPRIDPVSIFYYARQKWDGHELADATPITVNWDAVLMKEDESATEPNQREHEFVLVVDTFLKTCLPEEVPTETMETEQTRYGGQEIVEEAAKAFLRALDDIDLSTLNEWMEGGDSDSDRKEILDDVLEDIASQLELFKGRDDTIVPVLRRFVTAMYKSGSADEMKDILVSAALRYETIEERPHSQSKPHAVHSPPKKPSAAPCAPMPTGLQAPLNGAAIAQHQEALRRQTANIKIADESLQKEKLVEPHSVIDCQSPFDDLCPDWRNVSDVTLKFPKVVLGEMCGAHVNFEDIQIGKKVGQGKTAVVHKALYQDTVPIALKKFSFGRLSPEVMATFDQEESMLQLVQHPNVVAFMGSYVDKEARRLLLLMEWLAGGCLHDVLISDTKPFDFDLVLRMSLDIARGMEHLHDNNIIHRDLKSHNLLVDNELRVKVADLGTAKVMDGSPEFEEVGSLGYTAPEVFDPPPEGYTTKADVFSYAVLLWEIYTRESNNPLTNLGTGHRYAEKLRAGVRPMIPDPQSIVQKAFGALISQCWATDPALRPTFSEIVRLLNWMIGRA